MALVVAAVGLLAATPAQAGRMGDASIVAEPGSDARRTSGGSATPFSLRLPAGAACAGDSANGGYRVQSFVVQASDDPGALRYRSIGPVGEGRYSLLDTLSRSFVHAMTAEEQSPDGPGTIVNIPTFDFAAFPPGTLPSGEYRIGIACSLDGTTVQHWDTRLAIERADDDAPGRLRWTALAGAAGSRRFGPSGAFALLPATAVAAAGALALARRRRPGTTAELATEDR